MCESRIGQHVFQRGAHRSGGEHVAGQGPAYSPDVFEIGLGVVRDAVGDLPGDAVGTGGDTAADALADDEDVRLEVPRRRASPGSSGDGVGLVDQEQGSVLRAQITHTLQESGLGQDDADVGQCWFGDQHRDVAVRQFPLDGREVVELRDARGLGDGDRGPHVPLAELRGAIGTGHHEGLVDGTVVAVGEREDARAAGDETSEAQRPPIRVRGGESEGPQRQSETAREVGTHPLGILARHHRGDAAEFTDATLDRRHRRGRGVPRHRPGVSQGEVDVLVAVDVGDPIPTRRLQIEGVATGPLVHPGHGDAAEEVVGGLVGAARSRGALAVHVAFARDQRGQAHPVDGHVRC